MDSDFNTMCDLWKQTQRYNDLRMTMEKKKEKAQLTIQQFTHKFNCNSSKMAELMWRNTLREDWRNIVYQENFDALDILDMTMDDVMSLPFFERENEIYIKEFYAAIIQVRDKITRPIAQMIYLIDPQGSPKKDWFLAQKILLELFEAKSICGMGVGVGVGTGFK